MNNKEKLLMEIFKNPTYSFHIRELARITKLNPNTVINIATELKKENLITKQKNKNVVEIKGNMESKEFIRAKRLSNLRQLYASGLADFLIDFYNEPESIVVLGSYSRGEDIEKSDIDIVIITNKKIIPDTVIFEKKLKRKLHIIAESYKDLSKEFYKNLINGVILHGYLQ